MKKPCRTMRAGSSASFVPRAGIEPARALTHRFLRPTRLPIPPPGQMARKGMKSYLSRNDFNKAPIA